MSESKLQAECFQWHWNTHPEQRRRLFMNYNNPPNSIKGNQLKAQGMVAGVADMTYLLPNGRIAFIEFKTPIGKQAEVQKQFQAVCTALEIPYFIIRTFDQFKECINSFSLQS